MLDWMFLPGVSSVVMNKLSLSLSLTEYVLEKNEGEKMRAYNDRILQVEKGSFVLLVYTTTGGMGPQGPI